jgi:hypothetical protein
MIPPLTREPRFPYDTSFNESLLLKEVVMYNSIALVKGGIIREPWFP